MKLKQKISANYLEKVPSISAGIDWAEENDKVTITVENTGLANLIAQKLFKKPRFSYIHLDDFGSFVWKLIDGESNLIIMGEKVKEQFNEKCEPLYPRLAKFFQILDSYGFIYFK